jgi:hypothetical protein
MAKLDIGATAFAGFRLIARNPLAPLVWGLVRTVLVIGPALLMIPVFGDLTAMLQKVGAGGAQPTLEELTQFQARFGGVGPLSWLLGLAAGALITGAIFRAVLQPEEKRFFFLRFGMGELMLAVLTLVFAIGLAVTAGMGGLVLAIVAAVAGSSSPAIGIGIAVVGGFALLGVLVWACVRLSMAGPMSFRRKTLFLFESWAMTRGNSGRIFLVALILLVMVWIVEAILLAVLMAVVGARLAAMGMDIADARNAVPIMMALSSMLPTLLGLGAVSALASGYISAILLAPLAEASRVLSEPDPAVS